MIEHLSTGILERFERQVMTPSDREQIYDHARTCVSCRQLVVDCRGEAIVLQDLCRQLLPADFEEPYHLEFELIEGYVDGTLSRIDRDTAELHLEVCSECCAEVIDFRDSLATMRAASQERTKPARESVLPISVPHVSRWLTGFSQPLRAATVILLILLTVAGVIFIWRMRTPNQEAGSKFETGGVAGQSTPTPIQSTPRAQEATAGNGPDVRSSSREMQSLHPRSRLGSIRSSSTRIVLNDDANRVTLDERGNLSGLANVPVNTREVVKDVLLGKAMTKPEVINDLAGTQAVLRGNSGGETIKLIYPGRNVIVEDQPSFRWLPLKGASSYRVTVGDANFHGAAKSGDLPGTTTEWRPLAPLKRGAIYSWVVTAVKDGVEIGTSPSEPEMKFRVLEAETLLDLQSLKNSHSHLALGVFYAREGMLGEAEREFQTVVRQNPRSQVAKKLLTQIQAWQ